jgi:hypothetical protein
MTRRIHPWIHAARKLPNVSRGRPATVQCSFRQIDQ